MIMGDGNNIYDGPCMGEESESDSWRDHPEPIGITETLRVINADLKPAPPRNYILDADNNIARALSNCTGYSFALSQSILEAMTPLEMTQLWFALTTGNSCKVEQLIGLRGVM